jgi:hypothetical protein
LAFGLGVDLGFAFALGAGLSFVDEERCGLPAFFGMD